MFNTAAPYEITHSILAYYLTATLLVAAIFAWKLLRARAGGTKTEITYQKKMLTLLLSLAFFFATAVGLAGDESGKNLAVNQPIKFAAAESVYKTGPYQPLVWAGYVVPADSETSEPDIHYELTFPNMLSVLAFNNPSAIVTGLDAFPRSEWPPLFVHYFLNIMITIGIYLGIVPLIFFVLRHSPWRGREFNRPLLWAVIIASPLAFLAVEMGWMLTEIGRQPYIIRGIMRTAQAVTSDTDIYAFAWIFPASYAVLFVLTGWILRRHYVQGRSHHL
jgi:cytochrome d ubiquinol oxidase subunit I